MRPREMNWLWTVGAPLVRMLLSVVFRVRVEGVEHVARSGSAVLATNHISVLDGPSLSAVTGVHRRRATRNLVAAEVFRGLMGWILDQARQIPIRRGSGDVGALDEAVAALREGSCVGIFPEGRVSDDPTLGLQRMRSGLTRIALPSRAPVVPVGIWGTHEVWPRSGFQPGSILRRHTFAIVYGAPVTAHPGERPSEFRERYRAALAEAVERARTIAGGSP